MEQYISIHGHFYQPPRENPWLEDVELQDSAYPFHDWNERITAECYLPNATSRILDGEGKIIRIQNNYSKISFNFGPTLLTWMEEKAPEVYQAILTADRESQKNFSGHGSALAQAYSHMILPLANPRDKYTQIFWGVRDFEKRFGRLPEGIWLPEAGVDLETLSMAARLGIRFTILSPYQANRVRRIRGRSWQEVSGGRIDPSMAYELRLPSRRKINLFFYDGPIAHAVAFEQILSNGEHFAQRLLGGFSESRNRPQLVHIATDGETYGHHRRFGDMALAYALQYLESKQLARLTNYGEFLEKHPPTHEVEIFENSSWSCAHGVERWRSNCGCKSGTKPGWSQEWRAPLRESLDWLRDKLALSFEDNGRKFFKDPWAARNDYISVILDRSPENVERFFNLHSALELKGAHRVSALKLLEMQRQAMAMYTSCGWFFDELSGIETVQVIQYASRAIQLAENLLGESWESQFLERLERAKSNIPEHRDGRLIYEKFVKPAMVTLERVGAHYAVRSVFEPYAEHDRIYSYAVDRKDFRLWEAGKVRLGMGQGRFSSRISQESALLFFGVLNFEGHNLTGGVREFPGDAAYRTMYKEISEVFSRGDLPETIRLLDREFGQNVFSLKSLFRDEQRAILNRILDSTLTEAESVYLGLYERHAALLRFLSDLGSPLPKSFLTAAEFALNLNLRRALAAQELDVARVRNLVEEARFLKVPLDGVGLGYTLKGTLEEMARQWRSQSTNLALLKKLAEAADLALSLPFEVDFWRTQNLFFEMLPTVFPEKRREAEGGDEEARAWLEQFTRLGEKLSCRVT